MHIIQSCGRIAGSPQALDAPVELSAGEMATTLEHHVLKKVGQPPLPCRFPATASGNPQIKAGEPGIRQGNVADGDAVGQGVMVEWGSRYARFIPACAGNIFSLLMVRP